MVSKAQSDYEEIIIAEIPDSDSSVGCTGAGIYFKKAGVRKFFRLSDECSIF